MQTFYTVRPGDTLYSISNRWNIPLESLIYANNIENPNNLRIGSQLSMPPGMNTYRVEGGDTIYQIAQKYKISQELIINANNLKPPYTINIDQILIIPEGYPYYIVEKDDTLFKISLKYNVKTNGIPKPELIKSINNLSSSTIMPGMKLIIPYAPIGNYGLISFTGKMDDDFDIYTYDTKSGVVNRLTNNLATADSISYWSPNGRKIAFVGKDNIIYIVDLLTKQFSKTDAVEPQTFISWAKDNVRIAYGKGNNIIIYNVENHISSTINGSNPEDINFFSNGYELLFEDTDNDGISQVYKVNINTQNKTKITNNTNGPLHNIRLSPDNKFYLNTTPGASISLILLNELTSGNTYEVAGGPLAKNYNPTWSPNSSKVAFSATVYQDGYYSQVRTVGKYAENEKILSISNCFGTPVTWSPNNQWIAYLSNCSDLEISDQMWVVDSNHPAPILLLNGHKISNLSWCPIQ